MGTYLKPSVFVSVEGKNQTCNGFLLHWVHQRYRLGVLVYGTNLGVNVHWHETEPHCSPWGAQ